MSQLTFVDLFSGIGGFRLAFESIGLHCVFSSEINKHALDIYYANFKDYPNYDITSYNPYLIPDHDILCAGFPCQPFSISGQKKGFLDPRGTLFFDLYEVIKVKRPKAFILENVKFLLYHDQGKTLNTIIYYLTELGYSVSFDVLNAKDYGVPQNRERILIIGSLDNKLFDFSQLKTTPTQLMEPFLDKHISFDYLSTHDYTLLDDTLIKTQKSGLKFCGYLNKNKRTVGVKKDTEHLSRVHRQCNRIYSSLGTHPTITSQEVSGRYYIKTDKGVRKLTLNECFRIMGFPETFKKVGSPAQLYRCIGNSVCPPMIQCVGYEMLNQLF